MSEVIKPRGLHGFARVGLVAAWGVFWLNTALFPCCAVAAAVLGGHTDSASQSATAAAPPRHSDAAHSESLEYSPDSPCGHLLISGPPLVGDNEVLTPDRSPLEWIAVDASVATSLAAVNHSAIFALPQASPPPSLPFYLRTQRLLI